MAGKFTKQIDKVHNLRALLIGCLAAPHELLHVVGYRLAGKRCRYRWGQTHTTLLDPTSCSERLVGLLLPFGVFVGLMVIFGLLSAWAYGQVLRGESWVGFGLWTGLTLIAGGYAGTAIGDLRKAYLLVVQKPWYSWTPFDLFFGRLWIGTKFVKKLKLWTTHQPVPPIP